jgi:Ca-activated chloride channel homolog
MSQLIAELRSTTLGEPRVLLVLLLAIPVVFVVARSRLRHTPRPMRAVIVGMRLTVAALIVLALAQPTLRPAGHGRAVVFAVDVSDSIAPDQLAFARTWVQRALTALPVGSRSSVIEFGARAQLADASQLPPGATTDLTAALRLAGSILARDASLAPEIVLLSDGWQTTAGQPIDALPAGVAVSYVPLPPPSADRPQAVIHSLDVPSVARAGDRIELQLDLQAVQPVDAQLRLTLDQMQVANGPLHLEAGETQLSVPAPLAAPGFVQVRASLQVDAQTSTLASVVVVKPAGRVLVLEDDPHAADGLVGLLSDQGLQIERRAASSVPPRAEDLADFDAAILVDTPATSLSLDQQRTLQSFVQDLGRGLVVTGGSRTFSPGGYEGSVLDDVLPVSASPPIEPQQGSLALFLVIDRSGSMDIVSGASAGSGSTKMAMAREAAIEAAGLLQMQDTLGVIAFDSSFQWVVPPTRIQAPDDVKQMQARIATIHAGGGTSILAPLQAAFEAATNVDAPLKHVVLMTDGESNDRGYEDLLAKMSANQITLSTLAIGSDSDTRLLTSLAHLGGGRYYFTERSTQIPRIASKETNILTRNAIVEGKAAAVVADPSPILRSISGDLPSLNGYVATTRKDRAVTALETERGHPLLAHWQYGLGRVVAWTSEAQQGWASDWAKWPSAGQFWSQAVRWALPAPVTPEFQPTVSVGPDGRSVSLMLQALTPDGGFADLQDTRATVVSPDGSARELALPQRAPGVYGIDTQVSAPGEYRVLFKQGGREEVAAFTAPDAVEAHSVGMNVPLLDRLATDPTTLAPGGGAGPPIELWPWLLLAALLLLPVDVLLRRRA